VAWRGFLARVARGRIAELFHLTDPVGGRIHRNIRDCVKQFTDLRLSDSPSGLCIGVADPRPASLGMLFPRDEFERELAARTDHDAGTARILGHVRDILSADDLYGGRVRLFDLVQVIKRRFGAELAGLDGEAAPAAEGLTDLDIGILRDRCLTKVKEKIFLTYLGKGKLTRREATAVFEAVAGVVDDWITGSGDDRSLRRGSGTTWPSTRTITRSATGRNWNTWCGRRGRNLRRSSQGRSEWRRGTVCFCGRTVTAGYTMENLLT